MAIKVVTDSTADLSPQVAAELDLTVVPLTVFFGDEAFKDGIEISNQQFFDRLTSGGVHPRTSQPSVGEFEGVYRALSEAGHEIVSVHVSDKLSGTLNSALSATQQLPTASVELVDSRLASLGLGLAARAAALCAKAGGSLAEVSQVAGDVASRIEMYVVLDTLEYLQKGGRVGKAQALLGGLLSVKPVLTLVDGEIHPFEKVRTKRKAHERLKEIASNGAPWKEIALLHQTSADEVEDFLSALAPLSEEPILSEKIGPVIGTHAGPGAIGIALERS